MVFTFFQQHNLLSLFWIIILIFSFPHFWLIRVQKFFNIILYHPFIHVSSEANELFLWCEVFGGENTFSVTWLKQFVPFPLFLGHYFPTLNTNNVSVVLLSWEVETSEKDLPIVRSLYEICGQKLSLWAFTLVFEHQKYLKRNY